MKNNLVIVFDFDGTIANTIVSFEKIYNKLAKKYHLKNLSKEDFARLQDNHPLEVLREIGINGINILKLPFLIRDARKEISKEIQIFKAFPGIDETILELKKLGFKLGIVTSNSVNNVEKFLKNNDLENFDFVYSVGLFNKDKQIRKLIKKFKITVEDMIYIGDEIRDIEAARTNGIKVISVIWGLNSRKVLEKNLPDYLAETPQDIVKILKNQPPF